MAEPKMTSILKSVLAMLLVVIAAFPCMAVTQTDKTGNKDKDIRKVLFIGDSMTGWMGERFNAYGEKNGFDVATIVWDGSTIKKWAASPKLKSLIAKNDPDVVFVCLGINEMFAQNPQKMVGASVDKILTAVGNRELVWVGPPSWPGKEIGEKFNTWLGEKLGDSRYFNSFGMKIQRQSKKNPHPSRPGMIYWTDSIARWIPGNTLLKFKSLDAPAPAAMKRGKVFIYKKMKETL